VTNAVYNSASPPVIIGGASYLLFSGYSNTGVTPGAANLTAATSTWISGAMTYSMTPNTVSLYRLVSASATLKPTVNMLNLSGVSYATVVPIVLTAPAVPYVNAATLTPFSGSTIADLSTAVVSTNLATNEYNAVAYPNNAEYCRLIYVPESPEDMKFFTINDPQGDAPAAQKEQLFMFTVAGMKNGSGPTPLNLDIYLNFEVIPASGGVLAGMETPNNIGNNASDIATLIRQNPKNIAQTIGQKLIGNPTSK
jgi:hypothetical protein